MPSASKAHTLQSVCASFKLHRKSCQCPPWSCIAIFCSSKRPAPQGWRWHMALVQIAEPLPWQAARYLRVLFANLTFYFISNRGKLLHSCCSPFICSHFLAYNSIGTTSGLMDVGLGHFVDVGRNVFVLLWLMILVNHCEDSPWYHKNAKNSSLECERALLFSQIFTPRIDFLLNYSIKYIKNWHAMLKLITKSTRVNNF